MDSQLDTPSVVAAQDPEGPSPWIPLGPAHLFFWVVLIWPLVSGLVFSPVMRLLGPRAGVFSWFFTAVFWALGGGAILLGFKGMQTENPGSAQRGAFIATIVIWLLQVAFGLVLRFQAIKFGDGWHTYLRVSPLAAPILAAVPMILLLASREEQSGGTFDASTASLALLGGLGFLGPFLLAFGVLIGGHPLMAAVWEALRHPSEAMKGEWFDGGDEALKGRVFGQMALAFALSAPLLVLLMLTVGRFGRSGFDMSATHWIRPVAAWLTSLLSALVALRTMRRSGTREGRGMAIAALVLFGLLILPALALAVFLLLLATHMIRL